MVKRVKTYIEGYDENLGGGIPAGHVVLLAGTPGTMKTSLAYSILYHNALRNGSKGLYISLEQSKESLVEQMGSLRMQNEGVKDNLAVLDISGMRIRIGDLLGESQMNLLQMYADNIKQSYDFDLLVLDSSDALGILADFRNPDAEYFKLFKWLRELKVTSFTISELPYSSLGSDSGDFDALDASKKNFLADGILLLTMDQTGPFETQRRIRCVKMRGTQHETGYFALEFDSSKFSATKAVS